MIFNLLPLDCFSVLLCRLSAYYKFMGRCISYTLLCNYFQSFLYCTYHMVIYLVYSLNAFSACVPEVVLILDFLSNFVFYFNSFIFWEIHLWNHYLVQNTQN